MYYSNCNFMSTSFKMIGLLYILHYFMQDVHADFESPIVPVHLLLRTPLILYSIFVVVTGLCARYKIL